MLGGLLPGVGISEPAAGKTGLSPRLTHSTVDSRCKARKIRGPWEEMRVSGLQQSQRSGGLALAASGVGELPISEAFRSGLRKLINLLLTVL